MKDWQIEQKSINEQYAIYKKKITSTIILQLTIDIIFLVGMILVLCFLGYDRWIELIIPMSIGFIAHMIGIYYYNIKKYLIKIMELEKTNPELKYKGGRNKGGRR